ncbi:MAG: DUF1491 family protein [Sphingomonadaceae bacterium]|nr:DUF1491 family protein [Sphingomonadaceae bacterium]
MIEPRLASQIRVAALRRLAEAEGDFVTILRKGDDVAGAMLVIGLVKGRNPVVYDRFPSAGGSWSWEPLTSQDIENEGEIWKYWQKRRAKDPDLWVIELDVASTERLNGLLAAIG